MGIRSLLPALAVIVLAAPATANAFEVRKAVDYDLDGARPGSPALGQLDLYTPDDLPADGSRPLVVYVHGGGWKSGDKGNRIGDKARLFTDAGYLFASVNYRLSPDPVNLDYPSDRIRFPDHPADVGEALAWLDRNVASLGGDPRRIVLIGHSAGAHLVSLVSTDPAYVSRWGMDPAHLLGTVSLDTDAYDVTERIAEIRADARPLFYSAFATPEENSVDGSWARGSPIAFADPGDPDFLFVTQAASPPRIESAREMATKLGQDPAASVFLAPYDHAGINQAVGSAGDTSGETEAIMGFIAARIGSVAAPPSRVKLSKRPRAVRRLTSGKRLRVRFRFSAEGSVARYECRLDEARFRRCASPKRYVVGAGRHTFRVVAIAPDGLRGPVRKVGFRVRDRR